MVIFYGIYLIIFVLIYTAFFFVAWLVTRIPFDPKNIIINKVSYVMSWGIIKCSPLWRVEIRGREFIDKGEAYVMVANHQSMMDIPFINLLGINNRWVSKSEVYKIPFFGWILAMRGDIAFKRGSASSSREMMSNCKETLSEGLSITIFPEGTRSKTGSIAPFKEGAFVIAKNSGAAILPVVVEYNYGNSTKRGLFNPPTKISLTVLEPVSAEEVKRIDVHESTTLVHDRMENMHKSLVPNIYE